MKGTVPKRREKERKVKQYSGDFSVIIWEISSFNGQLSNIARESGEVGMEIDMQYLLTGTWTLLSLI